MMLLDWFTTGRKSRPVTESINYISAIPAAQPDHRAGRGQVPAAAELLMTWPLASWSGHRGGLQTIQRTTTRT